MTLPNSYKAFETKYAGVVRTETLVDAAGETYGYMLLNKVKNTKAFFCRNAIGGSRVAIYKELFDRALKEKVWIIVVVGGDRFYVFTPDAIEGDCKEIKHGGNTVVTFPIGNGRGLQVEPDRRSVQERFPELVGSEKLATVETLNRVFQTERIR